MESMEDDDDKDTVVDDSKRKSRNLSEKKRRDQFNLLVNELSSMVSSNSRKMDKSTVLKSTIAFLKNHNEVTVRSRAHEIQENWKPSFLPNEEFTHLILEALDGFIMVFSSTGKIFYASESITSLLGHLPNDLLTATIYEMVYEEEQQEIYNILLNPPKTIVDPIQSGILQENQISFMCHVKRGTIDNQASVSYEYVQFTGYFRDNVDIENVVPTSRYSGYSGEADTRLIFVGTGRLMTPQLIREMTIVDTKSEFTSRHSLEWKFLFLDHRAPPIIGYLPFEVLGTSGYDYYHFDDLERVVTCHEALMQKGEGTSCFYRFLTKGQQWIWLQTRFYITYHQWNSKPEFVVCTHRVISYADVMKQMKKSEENAVKDVEDNDSITEDRKAATSTSMMATSPWSSKSSRASKSFVHTQGSPNLKVKRQHTHHGHDSDSATSMSADSPVSHHSMLTQHSSVSQRSRSRQNLQPPKPTTSHQVHQYSQFNVPHPQIHLSSQHQPQQQPQLQIMTHPQQQSVAIHAPTITTLSPQHMPNHQHHRPQTSTQIVGSPYIDQQSQFIAAIPVQPVLAAPSPFQATATVISPLQAPADYVHLTPAQNQIQDHLQRKHEELQKLIVQQQDELRRVSEQLFIARYGIMPSIVTTIPFVAPMDSTDTVHNESNRCLTSSSHLPHQSYQEQHLSHPQHNLQTQNQMMTHIPTQLNEQMQHGSMQPNQNQTILDSNMVSHQPQISIQYDMNTQKSTLLMEQQTIEADQQSENIMQQYMQHQSQTMNQQSNSTSQHQQMMQSNDFELMPFQMMNQQAQLLFSSGNSDNNNSSTSNVNTNQ